MLNRLRTADPGGLLGVLVALLVAGVVLTVVVDDDQDPQTGARHRTITIKLGGPGQTAVALPPVAQEIVATEQAQDAADAATSESDLHEAAPPDAGVLRDNAAKTPDGQPDIPKVLTDATPSVRGCATALVRNYSSRNGAPILLGVIHWTGSRPTLGSPAGGLAIVRWFDTPAASASSNEITDQDGRCWLVVPEALKSWTQAGFNPWSVSVEIINQGVQPLFQTAKARAAVVRLMRGWHKRWNLPYRRARVSGCRVIRSGFLAHRDLGACGGGHPDVGTFDLDGLIREAKRGDRSAGRAARRVRHATTHRRLRELSCADVERRARHPKACAGLYAENRRLHRDGL